MTSETRSKFLGVQRDAEDVKNHLKVGQKLETGYTSNAPPLEPIQFNPGKSVFVCVCVCVCVFASVLRVCVCARI